MYYVNQTTVTIDYDIINTNENSIYKSADKQYFIFVSAHPTCCEDFSLSTMCESFVHTMFLLFSVCFVLFVLDFFLDMQYSMLVIRNSEHNIFYFFTFLPYLSSVK